LAMVYPNHTHRERGLSEQGRARCDLTKSVRRKPDNNFGRMIDAIAESTSQ